jgi:hypothetical protein
MWNHRVVETEHIIGDEIHYTYGVHECYYDNNGLVHSCTSTPINVSGDTVKDLKWLMPQLIKAFDAPVLKLKNIPEEGAEDPWKIDEQEVKTILKDTKNKQKKPRKGGCSRC